MRPHDFVDNCVGKGRQHSHVSDYDHRDLFLDCHYYFVKPWEYCYVLPVMISFGNAPKSLFDAFVASVAMGVNLSYLQLEHL